MRGLTLRDPALVASLRPSTPSLLIVDSNYGNGWTASVSDVTIDVAAALPLAQAGDLLIFMLFFSASGGTPATTEAVPTGWTSVAPYRCSISDGGGGGTTVAIGIYRNGYVTSLTFKGQTNVNYKWRLFAIRGADMSSPILSSDIHTAYNDYNIYTDCNLPTGRSRALLITAALNGNNSATELPQWPKPGNINDADTVYWAPNSRAFGNPGVHTRFYENPSGGVASPGVRGNTSQWAEIASLTIQSAI